ncbi:MAG: hypothetical protein Kow00124_28730 [Anaerolineae bacterium]
MNRHVDHLLAAYVDGRLTPRRAARVRQHLIACPRCLDRAARLERLQADLRLTVRSGPPLTARQVTAWWEAVCGGLQRPRPLGRVILLPVTLSLLVLLLPLAIGPAVPAAAAASLSPAVDLALAPAGSAAVEQASATPAPLVETPPISTSAAPPAADVLLIALPAPLAPAP